MNKRLFVDLDGVLADFDRHYATVFGPRDQHEKPDWKAIHGMKNFFLTMPLCEGAMAFMRWAASAPPIILTAATKSHYHDVARQKTAWVRRYVGDLMVLPVPGGEHKPLFMQSPGDILVDDKDKNCKAWRDAGGWAVHHDGNWETTIRAVQEGMTQMPKWGD